MADGSTIGLVLGSSVFASFLTQGITIARDYFARDKAADHSALYLAMALEAYGRSCSECISQSEMYEASGHSVGSAQGKLPAMADLPNTIDWKALGIRITAEAMALPIAVETTNVAIDNAWDVLDDDDAIAEVREAAAKFGIQAFVLAQSVRRKRGIPALRENEEWNALKYLEERRVEYDKNRRLMRENHDRLLGSLGDLDQADV